MPRNRPDRLRKLAALPPTIPIPGLPTATSYALDRLGRSEISSTRVVEALTSWSYVCSLPRAQLGRDHSDYTAYEGPMARAELERALRSLPRRRARALRRIVSAADDRFAAKTTHNPSSDPDLPWWARRTQH